MMDIQQNHMLSKLIPDALIKHGIEVFGTEENFEHWLQKDNFFFDNKSPLVFINTNEGLKFIDDRLTGIEYGDNV
jgi:uncharacterized protein (DUF2384 family)